MSKELLFKNMYICYIGDRKNIQKEKKLNSYLKIGNQNEKLAFYDFNVLLFNYINAKKKVWSIFCFWLLYLFFVFKREKCIILQLLKVASRCGVGRGRVKGMTPLLSLKIYIFRTNRYTNFSQQALYYSYTNMYT